MNILVVVDMQKDFIDGALGTKEAVAIVPGVVDKIRGFEGLVIATRDTHGVDYLETEEGRHLPVVHCVKDTPGWQLHPEVEEAVLAKAGSRIIDKPTFGSVGLCTDICVISNALLLKAYLPEVPVEVDISCCAGVTPVDISCCAGVTPATHEQAAEAMKMCQIGIV